MKVFVRSDYQLELVAETPEESKIITTMGDHGSHVQAFDRVSTKARIILVPELPVRCR